MAATGQRLGPGRVVYWLRTLIARVESLLRQKQCFASGSDRPAHFDWPPLPEGGFSTRLHHLLGL
jgi:hypothetical protein